VVKVRASRRKPMASNGEIAAGKERGLRAASCRGLSSSRKTGITNAKVSLKAELMRQEKSLWPRILD